MKFLAIALIVLTISFVVVGWKVTVVSALIGFTVGHFLDRKETV
jgi:uncharacterized membrane protein